MQGFVGAAAEVVKTCATCGGQYPGDALFCPADGTPLRRVSGSEVPNETDPYLKAEIAGHIEIRQLAGIGAMGRVYRAFQRGIDRDVAVKILHRELSSNPQLVSRFTREAKVASKLMHPNVVSVLLTGQMPDSAFYIVMEYLDGMSLMSALAAAGGALPLTRALHIAIQLADAVGEAHAVGIVHRDLKPENVMLVRRGEDRDFVKVLDFGIARVHWGEQSMATAAGLIFGTARYISPEGARGEAVTAASDVYAIATLAYQMISGRTPFEGDQAVGLLVQQIHDKPPPLKSLTRAAYVPELIADVIMAGLAKDPNAREKDARSFGRALVDAARASGLSSDEISRPILGGRVKAVSLPSMERTKQLDLPADVRDRMASVPEANGDARLTPEPDRASGDRISGSGSGVGAAGNATVKWTPPPNISAQLAAVHHAPRDTPEVLTPSPLEIAAAVSVLPTVSGSTGIEDGRGEKYLDRTLDDGTSDSMTPAPLAPLARSATPPPVTQYETPVPLAANLLTAPRKSTPVMSPSPGKTDYVTPAPELSIPTPAPSSPMNAGAPRPTYPSKPPSNVDSTMSDAENPRSGVARALMLVLICFVLGAGLSTIIAYRMGRIGADAGHEDLVSLAQTALTANRFTDPPGENVRDLTATGMNKWPEDSRFISLRKRAAEELTARAIAAHESSDKQESVRLIRNAVELDPDNASAKKLASDWDSGDPLAATATQTARPLSPLTPKLQTPPNTAGSMNGSAPATYANGVKVTFDVSNPKPKLGAAVELVGHVAGAKKVEDAHVSISSTSTGTNVVCTEDGGAYRAGFTFLEAGKYDVVFIAKVDGVPMKSARIVVAGDAPIAPPPTAGAPTGATATAPPALPPAPSGTVKWM